MINSKITSFLLRLAEKPLRWCNTIEFRMNGFECNGDCNGDKYSFCVDSIISRDKRSSLFLRIAPMSISSPSFDLYKRHLRCQWYNEFYNCMIVTITIKRSNWTSWIAAAAARVEVSWSLISQVAQWNDLIWCNTSGRNTCLRLCALWRMLFPSDYHQRPPRTTSVVASRFYWLHCRMCDAIAIAVKFIINYSRNNSHTHAMPMPCLSIHSQFIPSVNGKQHNRFVIEIIKLALQLQPAMQLQ